MTKPSMMDRMAEGLSQLLGCTFTVVRAKGKDYNQGWRVIEGRISYVLSVRNAEGCWDFQMGSNPNEVKRLLAVLSDLVQMGFVKVDEEHLRRAIPGNHQPG